MDSIIEKLRMSTATGTTCELTSAEATALRDALEEMRTTAEAHWRDVPPLQMRGHVRTLESALRRCDPSI